MNKWLRRTAGTVGIASGIWLLGTGAAYAADPSAGSLAADRLPASPLLDDLFAPAGDLAGGPVDVLAGGPVDVLAGGLASGPAVPGILPALPISDVMPMKNLGGLASAQPVTRYAATESLTGLPLVGGLLPGSNANLPVIGTLPVVGSLAGGLPVVGSLAGGEGTGGEDTGSAVGSTVDQTVGSTVDRATDLTSDQVTDQVTGPVSQVTGEDLPLVGSLPIFDSMPAVAGLR